ncbi:putative phosphite transport system-binding protein PtxB [Tachypleus tridentatus]|uniref:putative phosphite transport system-binding protein PtxB n=1 Tax=Tachypleus tridentatus TaxID=6853 RepID=UPI003FD42B7E
MASSIKSSIPPSESAAVKLRAATYLSPSIPVEFYEMTLNYLEKALNLHTTLMYESRWEGPPPDRADPFIENELDLAWMSSTVYLRMLEKGNKYIELLPVSSIHLHPRGEDSPGYFADVIIHKDLSEKVKEFLDLRGSKWAYNRAESLSGHIVTLQTLKELGENASFFGNILYAGSHLESIRMVINKKADAAAVDANCLALFLDRNPCVRDDLRVLTSWGMLTPYPLVVNKRLPDELKSKIVTTLLNMHKTREGAQALSEFRVRRFASISLQYFDKEMELIESTRSLSFDTVYY